jgi:hypothetical protein
MSNLTDYNKYRAGNPIIIKFPSKLTITNQLEVKKYMHKPKVNIFYKSPPMAKSSEAIDQPTTM